MKHESSKRRSKPSIASLSRADTAGTLPFAIDRARLGRPQLASAVGRGADPLDDHRALDAVPESFHAHAPRPTSRASGSGTSGRATPPLARRSRSSFSRIGGITPQPSVVLTIPGTTIASEVVVIGAHQDSTRSGCSSTVRCVAPGADDDASGVATISEVIRVALAAEFLPQRTVKFMAYAAEEVGLDGSDHIAATFARRGCQRGRRSAAGHDGYTESTTDIALIVDADYTDAAAQRRSSADLIDTYLPDAHRTTTMCGYACSDHASWQTRGFRPPSLSRRRSASTARSSTVHRLPSRRSGGSAAHAAKFARIGVGLPRRDVASTSRRDIFSDDFASGDTSAWSYVGSD